MGSPNEILTWKAGERSSKMFAETGSPNYRYSVGYVCTPHGVVGVYRQDDLTLATFVCDGKEHRARWEQRFTDARLVTECKRFAAGRQALSRGGDDA